MKGSLTTILLGLALSRALSAAPLNFDFKDPKGVNNITFKIDAPLESTTGAAAGISGRVTFDPDAPAALQGRIVVATASLHVPNPMMNQHLLGPQWMDAARFPEITFDVEKVSDAQVQGNDTRATVTGRLTIKGVTKPVTTPVRLTYLKDKLPERFPRLKGDLLVVRAHFTIRRDDFGINPGKFEDKVSEDIQLDLSLAGQSPR